MDIWKKMYEYAKKRIPSSRSNTIYFTHHVVCALEAEDGQGFCFESCCGARFMCRTTFITFREKEFKCLDELVENYCSNFLLKITQELIIKNEK